MRQQNKEQLAASKPDCGINLVIAGAGTGKTSTMISKIKNVITEGIVKPEEILILTFSRKAAEEINERLSSEFNSEIKPGFSGTFHSFSLKLLKENSDIYLKNRGIKRFPTVIGNAEKTLIMRELVMKQPEKFMGLPADVVLSLSDNIEFLNGKTLKKLRSGQLYNEICNILVSYKKYKNENLFIEFEDMINHAAELLESSYAMKKSVNEKYKYIFVDEFQDTSENNFRLLRLLISDTEKNLFMVGDDYQSIYRFRHSRVEYIINAKKIFPEITIHKLTVNYRSKKEIISISNRFILLNRFRTSKKIISYRGKGGSIRLFNFHDIHDEFAIIQKIISSAAQGISIAVLYRNNYQGEFLKKKYESLNIENNVSFLTMHGSKGLEFDLVIIAGISDRIIPDRTTDLEEERRLFYVALTRAKNELYLLYQKNGNDELPRFIRETVFSKRRFTLR